MNQLVRLHTFMSFADKMQKLCNPLNRIGIDYISYTRVYYNGARIFLSSNTKLLDNHYAEKKYLRVWNEGHPSQYSPGSIMLWKLLPNQNLFSEVRFPVFPF